MSDMALYTDDSISDQFYEIIVHFLIKQFKIFDEHGNISDKFIAPNVPHVPNVPNVPNVPGVPLHKQSYQAYEQHFSQNPKSRLQALPKSQDDVKMS